VVEQAKERLPIWKKERFDDGTTRWRENAGPSRAQDG
jgi:molybdopterin synthase catalytic subunit